eukprot:5035166-Amphidinium_carterae.2
MHKDTVPKQTHVTAFALARKAIVAAFETSTPRSSKTFWFMSDTEFCAYLNHRGKLLKLKRLRLPKQHNNVTTCLWMHGFLYDHRAPEQGSFGLAASHTS